MVSNFVVGEPASALAGTQVVKRIKSKSGKASLLFRFVPHNEIFSNRFLEDLEKIWELRYYIPDPNKLEYANCECAPCSRYKGEIIQGW